MVNPKPQFLPRMGELDALRSFALLGVFAVHMQELYELYWLHPATDPVQLRWHQLVFSLFSGKAFGLLALCFGVSFFIIMDRATRRGVDFTGRFVWRLILLGLLGFVHGLLYRGDILEVLALMGLMMVPFYQLKSNTWLVWLAALLLLRPFALLQILGAVSGVTGPLPDSRIVGSALAQTDLTGKSLLTLVHTNLVDGHDSKWAFLYSSGRLSQVFSLSLLGIVLGRINFFGTPEAYARTRLVALVIGLIATLGLHMGRNAIVELVPSYMPEVQARWENVISGWTSLAHMTVLMMGFLTICYSLVPRLTRLLAPAGRMTLTLYVGQSLVFVPFFYSFGLNQHATMQQSTATIIAFLVFAAQILIAHLWFRKFLYGPLEWLWRAGTYLTLQVPMLRGEPSAGTSPARPVGAPP